MIGFWIVVALVFCILIVNIRPVIFFFQQKHLEKKYHGKWMEFRAAYQNDNIDHTYVNKESYESFGYYLTHIQNIRKYDGYPNYDEDYVKVHNVTLLIIIGVIIFCTGISIVCSRRDNDIKYVKMRDTYEQYQTLVDMSRTKDTDLFTVSGYTDIIEYNNTIVSSRTKQNVFPYSLYYTDKYDWNDLPLIEFR